MNIKLDNGLECHIGIRLPTSDKKYYERQLIGFCKHFNEKKLISIQFGKQDTRGTESITFIDKSHCVPIQHHFNNKWELLGYVVGFNASQDPKCSRFGEWLK